MPTGDMSCNPINDMLETKEQREARLAHEQKMKEMMDKLTCNREELERLFRLSPAERGA
jgi:hypothetical protein